MKLAIVLLIAACLQASAAGYPQSITINESNIPLQKVFDEIGKQTNYHFLYADEVHKTAHKVSLNIEKGSIEDVLEVCFKDQQLTYIISGKTIIIKRKSFATKSKFSSISLSSMSLAPLAQTNVEPLIGVSVTVKGTSIGSSTNSEGMFAITASDGNGLLVFSYVGFTSREIRINGRSRIDVTLEASISSLDQVVVVGYGTQKKESVVGAIAHVGGDVLQQR